MRRPHTCTTTSATISDVAKRIVCECGYIVRGEDDEQVVELGREHMQANHPAIAAVISAEELLEMAEEE